MKCRYPLAGVSVGSIMRPLSVFVSSRDMVTRCRALMRQNGLNTIPVLEGGRLEGVITQREILKVHSTRSNIPVAGILSPARLMITPTMDISRAATLIADLAFDEIPVVQNPSDRTVVGIVKIEDLLRRVVGGLEEKIPVKNVMSKDVVHVGEDDDINSAWETMERSKLSGLPVVRYDKTRHLKKVIGLITRTDIVRYGTTRISVESKKGRTPPKVKSVMMSPTLTISPEAPVEKAVEIMLRNRVKRLPVVEDGRLVGILSRVDVIKEVCR